MPHQQVRRRVAELTETVERMGAQVENWKPTGKGHLKLYLDFHGRKIVATASKNPGCPRANENWRTQVRRMLQGESDAR